MTKVTIFGLFMLAGLVPLVRAQQSGTYQRAAENAWWVAHTAAATGYYPGYGYGNYGGGRVARDLAAGLAGAGIGGVIGGRKVAIIGSLAGVAAAEILMARRGVGIAGPSAGGGYADFYLVNATSANIEVWFIEQNGKEKSRGVMPPGAEWPVDGRRLKIPRANTREGYIGYAAIPNQRGGLTSDRLIPRAQGNAWVFVEPPEAAGR